MAPPSPSPSPSPPATATAVATTTATATSKRPSRRGHRRRLLERLSRIASAPQLSNFPKPLPALYPSPPTSSTTGAGAGAGAGAGRAASCVSLYTTAAGTAPPSPAAETVEIPYGTRGESLRISIPLRRKTRRDLWTGLPDEVKVGVLRWLKPRELVRCSAVDRKWHSMCFDGQLWSTLDATEFYDRIPVDQLAKIVTTAGPFVKYLNLRGCIQLTNDWRTPAIWNAPRNLLTATLEGCALSRTSLQFLIIRNPTLLTLNLSGLPIVTNAIARLIAQSCPNLESLDVAWCTKMDARGIKKIIDACPRLRDLRACELDRFSDTSVMASLWRTNTLETLDLAACPGLGDDAILALMLGPDPELDPFTNKPRTPPRVLRRLNVARCTRITDAALRGMAGNVPLLEGLEVGGCTALTDAGFVALIATVGRLTHLDMEECAEVTNATLVALARGPAARGLRSLGVSYCENVGDVGIVEVVRKCRKLANLECDNTRVSDLLLTEASHAVRYRPSSPGPKDSLSPRIALRLVVYDCASITWPGIRGILARNTEAASHPASTPDLIQLKCFYGWQPTVDAHTTRVLRGALSAANRIEARWAEHMTASEDAAGGRRRRRRVLWAEEEAFGAGVGGFGFVGQRRGARAGCVVS